MKLLQWNVWVLETQEHLVEEIKKHNPDIVCAQEMVQKFDKNIDFAKYISEKLGYNYFLKESDTWSTRPEKDTQGNAIFSKFPITKTSYTYIQDKNHNSDDPSQEGRVYVEADLDMNGKVLHVGTTHLTYTPRFEITESRKVEINKLIDVIKTKKERYIFTGDLNSTPDSYTIQEISRYLKSAGPDYQMKSWTTKKFNKSGFRETKLNWRLDYVFCTSDINVMTAQIVSTPYSDHLPVLVEFV